MPEKPDKKSTSRKLRPAAKRALAEAEERRTALEGNDAASQKETGGRGGPDPVRYGDWEKDGLASDF